VCLADADEPFDALDAGGMYVRHPEVVIDDERPDHDGRCVVLVDFAPT
jgi:hypothetical protein